MNHDDEVIMLQNNVYCSLANYSESFWFTYLSEIIYAHTYSIKTIHIEWIHLQSLNCKSKMYIYTLLLNTFINIIYTYSIAIIPTAYYYIHHVKKIGHGNMNFKFNYFIIVLSCGVVPVFMLRWPIFYNSTIFILRYEFHYTFQFWFIIQCRICLVYINIQRFWYW